MNDDNDGVVSEEDWRRARAAEREDSTHPCDAWNPYACFCKGVCTCHWIQVKP